MKAQDSIGAVQQFCGSNCGGRLRAGIAYQSWQTACGAVPAMCSSNRAHRIRRWLIIEKNAAATIHLQVDEAGRKQGPRRHNFGRPIILTLITRRDAPNHPTIDQDDRIIVPSISIENTVSRNCEVGSSGGFG
jgi:hypothetical protein